MGAPKGHLPYAGSEKGGRPVGSKSRNWLSLQYWFGMIAENAEELTPKEKINVGFRAVELLAPKLQVLPQEPGDSVDNAQRTMVLLKALEESKKEAPIDSNTAHAS